MLRDDVLDFWDGFRSERSIEAPQVLRAIEPKLGRLVVFDPRIPHGVRAVSGTHDPREGRLVIHGWFVQPRPFVEGAIAAEAVADKIGALTAKLGGWIEDLPFTGMVALRFRIAAGGGVGKIETLSDNTRVPKRLESARRWVLRRIAIEIGEWKFGRQRGASVVTLPLVFER